MTALTIPSVAVDGHLPDLFKAQSHMLKRTGKEPVLALSTKNHLLFVKDICFLGLKSSQVMLRLLSTHTAVLNSITQIDFSF